MKTVTVQWLGKEIRVPAIKAGGKLWIHWQGETHVVELTAGVRRTGGAGAKLHPGVIQAPMPGKVTQVLVKKEQAVQKGQPLVVLEAMKMEYTLEADRDGKIQELNVQAGAQVGLGEVLVRLAEV
ncbi:MAG: biotin/lipoyl-containing protein [Bdellovibrionales bacterium]